MRPVAYVAAMLVAFVLAFFVVAAVSPYAIGRPLIVAIAWGLGLPWLLGLALGDRDRAGVMALAITLLVLAGASPMVPLLILAGVALLAAEWLVSRRRPMRMPWAVITRVLTAAGVIALLAVGIKAIQDGRVTQVGYDLAADAPAPLRSLPASSANATGLPDIYLVLLDGYPRPDKLASDLGYDDTTFTTGLRERGFLVADHSRSNYTLTRMTLASMFNGSHIESLFTGEPPGTWEWRRAINEGQVFRGLRDAGYEIVTISSGFESVAIRQADRFIDTGQVNEFEWVLIQMTGIPALLDRLDPRWLADAHRSRIEDSFRVTAALAREPGSPRFVFLHIASPHSPLVFGPTGEPTDPGPIATMFDDALDVERLGWAEYGRRLGGQVQHLNARVLDLVDQIEAADRGAAVVVFSDHGSGARYDSADPDHSDLDLRTANLFAVRTPGESPPFDDRSTLVNVMGRLMRLYIGEGPADVAETIRIYDDGLVAHGEYLRPD